MIIFVQKCSILFDCAGFSAPGAVNMQVRLFECICVIKKVGIRVCMFGSICNVCMETHLF